MAAALFVPPRAGAAFVDGQGHVYAGGKLNFYITGTTTPLDTYTSSALSVANANPVVADANGLFASIYMTANTLYKVVYTTSAGVTIWTVDPYVGVPLTTAPAVGLLRSYLSGLTLSRNSGTPNTKIDVAAGVCTDSTNTLGLIVTAGTIDTGTVGANGLDAGVLVLSAWYHCYAIGKVDGTTALLMSTSASSPTLPTGYTLFRRIGSVKTDASVHFLAFTQDGDDVQWTAFVAGDVNAAIASSAAVTATLAGVPTGIRVTANLQVVVNNTNVGAVSVGYLSDIVTTDTLPVNTSIQDTPQLATAAASLTANGTRMAIRTNTSAQIRYRFSNAPATTTIVINTLGWTDRRGRDA